MQNTNAREDSPLQKQERLQIFSEHIKVMAYYFTHMAKSPRRNVTILTGNESFIKKIGNRRNPGEKPNTLVRSVRFFTTTGMLSTFTLFEYAPMKLKPTMSNSFTLNLSVQAVAQWV